MTIKSRTAPPLFHLTNDTELSTQQNIGLTLPAEQYVLALQEVQV